MREALKRLIQLIRPRLLPGVLLLPLLGWCWAHWDRALALSPLGPLARLLLAWTLLHAGTMWLNAARDRDRGEVLLGEAVEVPPGTDAAGFLALVLAVAIGFTLTPSVGGWTALCAILSVLYSHPLSAWKARPLLGPLVNVVGYGLASPAAGFSLVGMAPTPRGVGMLSVLMLGVLGAVFVAQAFQEDDDRARGDRTLVARRGPGPTLQAARLAFASACGVGTAMVLAGWLPWACGLAVAGWVRLDVHLAAASRAPRGGGLEAAVESGRRLVLVVSLGVLTAAGHYAVEAGRGGPVAGLATRGGHPTPDVVWWERLVEDRRRAMTIAVR